MPQRSSSEQCLATSAPPNVGPSQILPFLYLGSQEDVLSTKVMQDHHITHVINVSISGQRAPFLDENDDEHFLRIPVNDCLNAQLLPYFDQAFSFIEKARLNNGRVFIHCLAGISRSPALAVAYIMRHLNLSVDDAYRYIKARRSHISPNFNFMGQLSEYERSLPSSTKISTTTPIVKCITIEPPLNDRRRFIQVEGSSSLKREHNNDQPKILTRPKGFNFDLVNTHRPQSLLSPSSGIANLSVESPQPQHTSLPSKLLRPNSITLKRSSPTDEFYQPSELINSRCNNELNLTNKRVKTLPRSTDTSPLFENNDLINTFFEETSTVSKSPHRSNSTQSLDLATESSSSPIIATTTTSNTNKSRTNSLSSSRELLVS
ncbi:unnamed protein product [Rotaria sp. Silwood1]|nr:unnamed protein product [Rotaria sp. Silwood1]CAF1439228.1 unnamed protein product [Rotaria sp. Silwood1]CAF3677731.1 unnamed protein product [Rotaria sp. Silwood1]CAF4874662.1 unnamed protein product [Rotaria sp. Silwood1]